MANLSQAKRQRMLEFINRIREEHKADDDVLIALGEIESELNAKKYGLVWEQHEEAVDVQMRDNIPAFTEVLEREITAAPGERYNFLLEGDNLHSLRLLEKTHRGKIDVIYIDKFINKLGEFFEEHQRRMYSDNTFFMLYDMVTEKVEEYILLPFLTTLFDKCEKSDGYWTFLEEMYPQITYSSDDEYRFSRRFLEPRSFIFSAILTISGFNRAGIVMGTTLAELPYYEELVIERIPRLRQEIIRSRHGEVIDVEETEDEDVGYICQFSIADIRKQHEDFEELLEALNDDAFICKKQYLAVQKFLGQLSARKKA